MVFKVDKYPEIALENRKLSIIYDESGLKNDAIPYYILKSFDFKTLELVKASESDNHLLIKSLPKRFLTEIEQDVFTKTRKGRVFLENSFFVTLKNKNSVLFEKELSFKKLLIQRQETTQISIAEPLLLKEANSLADLETTEFKDAKTSNYYALVAYLKNLIDIQQEDKRLVLYKFNDKELENINASVTETLNAVKSENSSAKDIFVMLP